MSYIDKMTVSDLTKKLEQTLVPAFRARYDLVCQEDPDFFKSETGQIELFSMALISNRIRKNRTNAMDFRAVSRAYTYEETADSFYEASPHLIAFADLADYPCQYEKINMRIMHLFDCFSKDLGLDPLYTRFDRPAGVQSPFTANGLIRNFDDLKHSALLSADIPTYYTNQKIRQARHISHDVICDFCDQEKEKFLERREKINQQRIERAVAREYFRVNSLNR